MRGMMQHETFLCWTPTSVRVVWRLCSVVLLLLAGVLRMSVADAFASNQQRDNILAIQFVAVLPHTSSAQRRRRLDWKRSSSQVLGVTTPLRSTGKVLAGTADTRTSRRCTTDVRHPEQGAWLSAGGLVRSMARRATHVFRNSSLCHLQEGRA